VQALQIVVRAVGAVQVAIVVERARGEEPIAIDRPRLVAEHDLALLVAFLKRRIPRRLVDVVPEVHHEIELLLGEVSENVIARSAVVLTRHDPEANGAIRVGRRCGARASGLRNTPLGAGDRRETIVVRRRWLELLDADLHAVIRVRASSEHQARRPVEQNERVEALVRRELELELGVAPGLGIEVARPEHDALGARITRSDRLREVATSVDRSRRIAVASEHARAAGDGDDGGEKRAARERDGFRTGAARRTLRHAASFSIRTERRVAAGSLASQRSNIQAPCFLLR
jgi:hypothetical protein